MIYDVHEIAKSGEYALRRLDIATNNLANANTPGFKQAYLHVMTMTDSPRNELYSTPAGFIETVELDFRQGALQHTGNSLDLAIEGEGFFVVMTEQGKAYTRNGNFSLDRDGFLITHSGDRILGTSGPIQIQGNTVSFDTDGTVLVDGTSVNKLVIVKFADNRGLRHSAQGYFETDQKAEEITTPTIKPGHLEMSNVNVLKEMISMIDIHRTMEIYQKLIHTLSEKDKEAIERVGRIA